MHYPSTAWVTAKAQGLHWRSALKLAAAAGLRSAARATPGASRVGLDLQAPRGFLSRLLKVVGLTIEGVGDTRWNYDRSTEHPASFLIAGTLLQAHCRAGSSIIDLF